MRVVAGLLAILLVVGCSDKDKVPSGIIPRDEMEKILWDMVEADQYSSLYLWKDSARINVKTETQKLYQEVFQLHQISREEFRKSFQYYQEHPDLTRTVFDSLLARGNRLRAESYSRPAITTSRPAMTTPAAPPPSTAPAITKPNLNAPKFPVGTHKPAGVARPLVKQLPGGTPNDRPVNNGKMADTAKGKQPK